MLVVVVDPNMHLAVAAYKIKEHMRAIYQSNMELECDIEAISERGAQ